MSEQFIHPNWHVMFIHYPIAMLITGTLIELLAIFWLRSGFRAAGRWMILIGALAAVPTALTGWYALNDVATTHVADADGLYWQQRVSASPLTLRQWDMLHHHVIYQAIATAVALVLVVTWLGCSDRWRRRLHLPFLVVLLGVCGAMAAGAWWGGEAVYRQGVAVDVGAGAAPAISAASDVAGATTTAPAARSAVAAAIEVQNRHPAAAAPAQLQAGQDEPADAVAYYVPPVEFHMTMAGILIALAAASLGLSIRAISQATPTVDEETAAETTSADVVRRPTDPGTEPMLRRTSITGEPIEDQPEVPLAPAQPMAQPPSYVHAEIPDVVVIPMKHVPSSRFWLLALLVGLLTLVLGLWIVSQDTSWAPRSLWDDIASAPRSLAHAITGACIVVLTLILAILSRFAWRRKMPLVIFAVLLVLAILLQFWLGTLLLYDTADGPLTGFNSIGASTPAATQPAP